MDDDSEDLKARIQELEDELQKLKDQKRQDGIDSAAVDEEIEEVHDQIRDEAENSEMSRRKFMKTLAGGGAALGAAAMMPSAAALDIESNNPLSYNENFSVDTQGNLNLQNKDISNVGSISTDDLNNVKYLRSEMSESEVRNIVSNLTRDEIAFVEPGASWDLTDTLVLPDFATLSGTRSPPGSGYTFQKHFDGPLVEVGTGNTLIGLYFDGNRSEGYTGDVIWSDDTETMREHYWRRVKVVNGERDGFRNADIFESVYIRCNFENNGRHGMLFQPSGAAHNADNGFYSCEFDDNGQLERGAGIRFDSRPNQSDFINCQYTGNGGPGLWWENALDRARFAGMKLKDNEGPAIYCNDVTGRGAIFDRVHCINNATSPDTELTTPVGSFIHIEGANNAPSYKANLQYVKDDRGTPQLVQDVASTGHYVELRAAGAGNNDIEGDIDQQENSLYLYNPRAFADTINYPGGHTEVDPAGGLSLGGNPPLVDDFTSQVSPSFGTWRQVSSSRPAMVTVEATVETDGTTRGSINVQKDNDGGTSPDNSFQVAHIAPEAGAGAREVRAITVYLPAGAQYQIANQDDPNGNNTLGEIEEVTL